MTARVRMLLHCHRRRVRRHGTVTARSYRRLGLGAVTATPARIRGPAARARPQAAHAFTDVHCSARLLMPGPRSLALFVGSLLACLVSASAGVCSPSGTILNL